MAESDGLTIDLLDRFLVRVCSEAVPGAAWRRRKPAALLKILDLSPGHRADLRPGFGRALKAPPGAGVWYNSLSSAAGVVS